MAPRLRVLAGTSPDSMVPITNLVNTSHSHHLESSLFEGEVVAHIKGLTDEKGRVRDSEYFEREDRKGVTWSIQVQGRFLVPYSADDILFGNTFDRPLKLPWGTSAVLKFMNYIDPTLEHDLTSSSKPWALSPLISTMPHFMHARLPLPVPVPDDDESEAVSDFPTPYSIKDATSELYLALAEPEADDASSSTSASSGSPSSSPPSSSPHGRASRTPSSASSSSSLSIPLSSGSKSAKSSRSNSSSKGSALGIGSLRIKDVVKKAKHKRSVSRVEAHLARESEVKALDGAAQRRSYFAQKERRREVVFGPEDLITTDFCYGFINFAPSLSLQLPGGLSFDLMKYWDGQPVRFVCCERVAGSEGGTSGGDGEAPWGRIFWCVAIEVVDDDDEADAADVE